MSRATNRDNNAGIPFQVSHEQQSCHLLELSPPLLALLSSKHPPTFYLKSSSGGTSSVGSPSPTNALLCTDDQTFQIRQVQSSNSIFVIQPAQDTIPLHHGQPAGVSAIAQCKSTLELIPIPIPSSATLYLKSSINAYDEFQGSTKPPSTTRPKEKKTQLSLSIEAPMSAKEFDEGWNKLCAFELDGQAWIPTAGVLLGTWKSFFAIATLEGLNLQTAFHISSIAKKAEEDGYPEPLFLAMINMLKVNDVDAMDGWATLSEETSTTWVGVSLLESKKRSDREILMSKLLHEWQDMLPELWRRRVSTKLLEGKYVQLSEGFIGFEGGFDDSTLSDGPQPASTKAVRKWHEKFKNNRR